LPLLPELFAEEGVNEGENRLFEARQFATDGFQIAGVEGRLIKLGDINALLLPGPRGDG